MNEKWDKRFLKVAKEMATWSKDTSTQVGAVLVDQDRIIRSTGYNGIPRNLDDLDTEKSIRPDKQYYYEHAERNVLWNCCNVGIPTKKCTMYVTHLCCPDCARGIIQCGIIRVVVDSSIIDSGFYVRWYDRLVIAKKMLTEAGVELTWVNSNE